jgi:hypothetical protein
MKKFSSIFWIIAFAAISISCTIYFYNKIIEKQEVPNSLDWFSQYTEKVVELTVLEQAKNDTILELKARIEMREKWYYSQLKKTSQAKQDFNIAREGASPECDAIIQLADAVISAQLNQIDSLETQAEDYSKLTSLQDKIIDLKNIQIEEAEFQMQNAIVNIRVLEKSNKRTWWEKNSKWITLGAGIGIGILIVK